MLALLHLPFENTRPLWLIEASNFEDLGRVQVRVGSPSHDGDVSADHLVDGSMSGQRSITIGEAMRHLHSTEGYKKRERFMLVRSSANSHEKE